jgi:hypothetical protein
MRFGAAVRLGLGLASPSAADQKIARKNLPPKVESERQVRADGSAVK